MAAFALAAALAVPATSVQAAEAEEPGELDLAVECLWQWITGLLPVELPGVLEANCDHGSHIDPNG